MRSLNLPRYIDGATRNYDFSRSISEPKRRATATSFDVDLTALKIDLTAIFRIESSSIGSIDRCLRYLALNHRLLP